MSSRPAFLASHVSSAVSKVGHAESFGRFKKVSNAKLEIGRLASIRKIDEYDCVG
jgi:hypothetical protein